LSRIPRVVVPGCWHHVTQRGNRRQTIFFSDADRRLYLDLLRQHCEHYKVAITGYCLLGNHVHVLAVPEREDGLARAFATTHTDYARWLNVRRGETGHVWQSRFFSCPLDEGHRWQALRYVELNSVRAGLVDAAELWPWSSARAHLVGHDASGLLSMSDWQSRWTIQTWRETLDLGIDDAASLDRLREATRTGRPAACDAFLADIEARLGRSLRPARRGPKPSAHPDEAQLSLVIE
jgi:putative transposase